MDDPHRYRDVKIVPAERDQRKIMERLFQLYLYDFSQFVDLEIDKRGCFEYPSLDLYWQEPDRFPYFIEVEGKLAGFVLIKKKVENVDDHQIFDVAEFFVLRSYRRQEVGTRSAHMIWDRFPGRWVVRVMKANKPAVQFWEQAVEKYTGGDFRQQQFTKDDYSWLSFHFSNVRKENI
ncbi:MAG: GNAT family N-acetyltransferase [Anaerolineales bacterium]